MPRRHFTPAQANKTLPLVRRIVADILDRGRELRKVASENNNDSDERDRLEQLGFEIRDLMSELEQIGCEYKDWSFDKGLVDFPSEIDGRPVLLCWRSDEPSVRWYHDVRTGYTGRTLIPEHLLAEEVEEAIEERSS